MLLLEPANFESFDVAKFDVKPRLAGSEATVEVLDELSKRVLASKHARDFPDLATFAFFCRQSNVLRYLQRHEDLPHRIGLGLLTHVTPGNIPLNFAYSFAMGVLAGNQNLVRLPSTEFAQIDIALEAISSVFADSEVQKKIGENLFFRSARGSQKLREALLLSDGIMVWGGDETVGQIRALPKNPTCREVYFASRRSAAILDARSLLELDDSNFMAFVRGFYNDTFLVDQSACSSPSVVYWLGTETDVAQARILLWDSMEKYVHSHWESWAPTGIRKLADLFETVTKLKRPVPISFHSNALWVTSDSDVRDSALRFGYFLELMVNSVSEIPPYLRPNEQTITYFGVSAELIFNDLALSVSGRIERICPVGRALDMGFDWDGKDTLPILSRHILVQ